MNTPVASKDILRAMYDKADLTEEEQAFLLQLSAFPAVFIPYTHIQYLWAIEEEKEASYFQLLSQLTAKAGWKRGISLRPTRSTR